MTNKQVINNIASAIFDVGVDIGVQLAAKETDVARRVQAAKGGCGCVSLSAARLEEIEFAVFEGNSRDTWELKAKTGAIAHVFNQEVESGVQG